MISLKDKIEQIISIKKGAYGVWSNENLKQNKLISSDQKCMTDCRILWKPKALFSVILFLYFGGGGVVEEYSATVRPKR